MKGGISAASVAASATLLSLSCGLAWAQQSVESLPLPSPLVPSLVSPLVSPFSSPPYPGAVPVLMWGVHPQLPDMPVLWPVWVVPVAAANEAAVATPQPVSPQPVPQPVPSREDVAVTDAGAVSATVSATVAPSLPSPVAAGAQPKQVAVHKVSPRKPVLPKARPETKPVENPVHKKRRWCWREGELGVCP